MTGGAFDRIPHKDVSVYLRLRRLIVAFLARGPQVRHEQQIATDNIQSRNNVSRARLCNTRWSHAVEAFVDEHALLEVNSL